MTLKQKEIEMGPIWLRQKNKLIYEIPEVKKVV